MSVSTELVLYTTEVRLPMRELTKELLGVFGNPESCDLMWREREERSWKEFLEDQQNFQVTQVVTSDWIDAAGSMSATEVLEQFPSAQNVMVMLSGTAIGGAMDDEISQFLPETLRNNCVPCQPTIQVGWHDIWECAVESHGKYFARAFVSIRFFSYDTPADPERFLAAICKLPVFTTFKQELEQVTGPLTPCLIMSV